ncbi:sensor histidine kinase [Cellulomonas wangsupingiae]|uniref:Histidine kinase n=1 Tax=Cellulomonas wangsupingiae TaxID=2968085 RepID=A0ABY5K4H3_9CELL|nr:histidine kinase [Cellulomonas wangsupingiae]MCC2334116.1 histidine kinase [Cellulomonas wangsupingiae]MCM0638730.1 histidine kinase [Cellulomonas wangsupingiae]UUI65359.1 histidine kinase [Cellulomonas wangsupingiae]
MDVPRRQATGTTGAPSPDRPVGLDAATGGAPDPDAPTARRPVQRFGAGAGMVAVLVIGLARLVTEVAAPGGAVPGRVVWWAAFALYVVTFAIDAELVRVRRAPPAQVLVVVEVVAGSVAWLAEPGTDWTSVLFVVTAVSATVTFGTRGAVAVVTLQAVVTAVGAALEGRGMVGIPFTVAIYTAFQVFAVMSVRTATREAQARREADAAHAALAAAHADLAAAHADLRATTALLTAAGRDAERLRIARDLHDVVGHQLTALALELEIASHRAAADAEAGPHVARARNVAKDLLRDVRAVVGELRGAPGGLESALEGVLALPGLDVDLDVEAGLGLDDERLVAVVRCVQEAATNALRHAPAATRLAVRVRRDGDVVEVDVHDDGPGAVAWAPGHGLRGMRERVTALGGTLAVDPGPGRGFRVTARVPA